MAHLSAQGSFAMMKYILSYGKGALAVNCNTKVATIYIRVNRSKITSGGKPVIADDLQLLHILYPTYSCKEVYKPLSVEDGEFEKWRQVVSSKTDAPWSPVQTNTLLQDNGEIELKAYDASNKVITQSFQSGRKSLKSAVSSLK